MADPVIGTPPGGKDIINKSLVDEFVKYMLDNFSPNKKKKQSAGVVQPSDLKKIGVQDSSFAMNAANLLLKRKQEQEAMLR